MLCWSLGQNQDVGAPRTMEWLVSWKMLWNLCIWDILCLLAGAWYTLCRAAVLPRLVAKPCERGFLLDRHELKDGDRFQIGLELYRCHIPSKSTMLPLSITPDTASKGLRTLASWNVTRLEMSPHRVVRCDFLPSFLPDCPSVHLQGPRIVVLSLSPLTV